jgi:hypothetical protein
LGAISHIWPATTFATDGGTILFGSRFRLKSTFNISGYSRIAQILLTQLKQYGRTELIKSLSKQQQLRVLSERKFKIST